jgi:hypothetical protein
LFCTGTKLGLSPSRKRGYMKKKKKGGEKNVWTHEGRRRLTEEWIKLHYLEHDNL